MLPFALVVGMLLVPAEAGGCGSVPSASGAQEPITLRPLRGEWSAVTISVPKRAICQGKARELRLLVEFCNAGDEAVTIQNPTTGIAVMLANDRGGWGPDLSSAHPRGESPREGAPITVLPHERMAAEATVRAARTAVSPPAGAEPVARLASGSYRASIVACLRLGKNAGIEAVCFRPEEFEARLEDVP